MSDRVFYTSLVIMALTCLALISWGFHGKGVTRGRCEQAGGEYVHGRCFTSELPDSVWRKP